MRDSNTTPEQIVLLERVRGTETRFNQEIEKLIKRNEEAINRCKNQIAELHEFNTNFNKNF